VAEIQTAYYTMVPLLGAAAGLVFLISLMASGISSSVVGTMAGQMIMQGFVGFSIPVWLRRLITIVPAFVVIGLGVNVTNALVVSQIVLSIVLPIPMVALLVLSGKRSVMGAFAARPALLAAAACAVVAIVGLNAVLVVGAIQGN
jgi:manganese transport protein